MNERPERLFRDDGGAALERAARLEDENRELRAEIERLRASPEDRPAPPRATVRADERTALALVLTVTTVLISLGATIGFRRHHHARMPRAATHMNPGIAITPAPPPLPVTAPEIDVTRADNCSVPYFYDDSGMKQLRPECLDMRKVTRRVRPHHPVVDGVEGADDCSVPYFYAADGHKRYKRHCFDR
jgi:hypothetical protein